MKRVLTEPLLRGGNGGGCRYAARLGRAASPGRVFPSSNSRAAPPPVEMNEILSDSPARWIGTASWTTRVPMDCEGGFATPDDGQGVGIGDGMGHREGPSGKGIDFEHAHGTVPENGLGILNCF